MSAFDATRDPMSEAVRAGNQEEATALAEQALAAGVPPQEVLDDCIVPVLRDIGDQFGRLEIFLPEMVIAADAAKAVIAVLGPALAIENSGGASLAKVVIGTVAGDIHDIGKTMVATMLEVNGFEVIDLGTDVSVQDFLRTARDGEADIIAISSLLTTSLPYVKDVLAVLDEAGDKERFKVMVGGGPVTEEWATEVGADGYGKDASEAVQSARKLVGAD